MSTKIKGLDRPPALPTTADQPTDRPANTLLPGDAEAIDHRKLFISTCLLFGYTVGTFRGMRAEISGYRNGSNEVIAQHIRMGDKQGFAWINRVEGLQLFGAHLGSTGRLILTEGQIDAMSVYQALDVAGRLFDKGQNTTVASITDGAQGGIKSIEANIRWILGFDEVILFFDLDDPGQAAAIKALQIIGPRTKLVSKFKYKDASEALMADDGAAISAAILSASVHRPLYVEPAPTLLAEVLKPRDRTGILFPWPSWNGLLGDTPRTMGMRPGEVWTLCGGSGLGKSLFARSIAVHAAMQGVKVGFIPLEETTVRSYDLMLSSSLGYRLDSLTQEQRDERAPEIKAMSEKFGGNITFLNQLGGTDFEAFVASVKHLVLAEGCKVVVLDHLSMLMDSVELNVDQRRSIDRAVKRIKEMTVELGFTMLMLSHLSRVDGKSHEEGARPQLRDLRGSHSIGQCSDFVVALQRNPQGDKPNETKCYLLKNRAFGQVGRTGTLVYDHNTGQLVDLPPSFDTMTDDD